MTGGALGIALSLGACTTPGSSFVASTGTNGAFTKHEFDKLLDDNPLGPNENIRAVSLRRGSHSAHLLVQVRDREPPHYHADSDITVLMVRGAGTMHVGTQVLATRAGDTVFIPRGVPHYFVNRGPAPAAALVTYSSAPGPQDRVLLPPSR